MKSTLRTLSFMALLIAEGCATAPKPPPSRRASHAVSEAKSSGATTQSDPASSASTASSEGMASFYGKSLAGRKTASGEPFNPQGFTAAHRTLPFGTCLNVENVDNGRQVQVRVNDRGPFVGGRILDVSEAAADRLGMREQGVARIRFRPC